MLFIELAQLHEAVINKALEHKTVKSDLDFNTRMVRVHGKGKKERLVPISLRGCEWLAFYLGKIRPMFAFIGSGKALFLANNGKRYVPGKLSYMASQYVKLAGFDRKGACQDRKSVV